MFTFSSIQEFETLILKLQGQLEFPLPGESVQMEMAPDFRSETVTGETPKDAAVLILIYPHKNSACLALTKRQVYNGHHSGQISLPGGKKEATDPSLYHTALRESKEEVGIEINHVKILGELSPLLIPISNYLVRPFVGFMSERPTFLIDELEVAELMEIPLEVLCNDALKKKKEVYWQGKKIMIPYFDLSGDHLWGATAMILNEFITVVKRGVFTP